MLRRIADPIDAHGTVRAWAERIAALCFQKK
jgi:hypothetical protein